MKVARVVIDALSSHAALTDLPNHVHEVDWSDFQSVNEIFKALLKTLEELYA